MLHEKVTYVKSSFSGNSDEKGMHSETFIHTIFLKLNFSSSMNYHHFYVHILLMWCGLFIIYMRYKPFFRAQNGPGKEGKKTAAVN